MCLEDLSRYINTETFVMTEKIREVQNWDQWKFFRGRRAQLQFSQNFLNFLKIF